MVSEIPSNWNTLQFSFILPVSSVVTSQWLKAHLLADRSVRANSQNPARLHVGLRLLRAVEVPSLSGRRGRRQLMLSSPSCSSIYCSSVTTRKQNLFITCLLFSNIYTFCCSMKKVFYVLVINFPYCSQRRRVLKNFRILQAHILQKGKGGKRLSYDLGYCTHLRWKRPLCAS